MLTVGGDPACDFASIQTAIDAAAAGSGDDVVRIARSGLYVGQAIDITVASGRELTLEGGYATCDAAPDGVHTAIRGTGGPGNIGREPVLAVSLRDRARASLRFLDISGAYNGVSGGGVSVNDDESGSAAELDVRSCFIHGNRSADGGGIYVRGVGGGLSLTIGPDVRIDGNTAFSDGGGVYLAGTAQMTMTAPGSSIVNNAAGSPASPGSGGGLLVLDTAVARIGSNGQIDEGTITGNSADFGGGIALGLERSAAGGDGAPRNHGRVVLYTSDAAIPLSIRGNWARTRGGAFHVAATEGPAPAPRIDASDVLIENNRAPAGAVLAVHNGTGSPDAVPAFVLNAGRPDGAVRCVGGARCTPLRNNVSSIGGVFALEGSSSIEIRDAMAYGNVGDSLFSSGAELPFAATVVLDGGLAVGNSAESALFAMAGSGSRLRIARSTIADNDVLFAAPAIRADGEVAILRSIFWHSGSIFQLAPGVIPAVADVLAREIDSLGPLAQRVLADEPRFVDADNPDAALRDYRLQAASPAVDFAAADGGIDLDGHPRDLDLPVKPNRHGPADLGAYERHALLPLVRNGDFVSSPHPWVPSKEVGVAPADDTAPGSPGKSVHADVVLDAERTDERVEVFSQCVFLPGPAWYRLNGWARSEPGSPAARDDALLQWELRMDGGETCDAGAPIASGDHAIGSHAEWFQPDEPAWIGPSVPFAPEAGWSENASLKISLVVVNNGGGAMPQRAAGWFDAVTLDVDLDAIFADGFD